MPPVLQSISRGTAANNGSGTKARDAADIINGNNSAVISAFSAVEAAVAAAASATEVAGLSDRISDLENEISNIDGGTFG